MLALRRRFGHGASRFHHCSMTEGSIKASAGRYQLDLARLEKTGAVTGYSGSRDGVMEGERMLVGLIGQPHSS